MSVTVPPDSTGIVIFDYPGWSARYPEFAAVTAGQAQRFFDEASLICDNTPGSPVVDLGQRSILLNMLTAHVAALNGGLTACGGISGGSGNTPVGRIASASEGSVSVSFDYNAGTDGPSAGWFQQTPYGLAYWNATAQYRTWRYFVGPRPFPQADWLPLGAWRRW